MQTFLPVPDFKESAKYLDRLRLGKQRVEAFNILETLFGFRPNWVHHPAVVMWKGCELVLAHYGMTMCEEWQSRGYEDNMKNRIDEFVKAALRSGRLSEANMLDPWWLGADVFHRTHRSQLLRKDPAHYRQFWPEEPDDLPYLWPDAHPGVIQEVASAGR